MREELKNLPRDWKLRVTSGLLSFFINFIYYEEVPEDLLKNGC